MSAQCVHSNPGLGKHRVTAPLPVRDDLRVEINLRVPNIHYFVEGRSANARLKPVGNAKKVADPCSSH